MSKLKPFPHYGRGACPRCRKYQIMEITETEVRCGGCGSRVLKLIRRGSSEPNRYSDALVAQRKGVE